MLRTAPHAVLEFAESVVAGVGGYAGHHSFHSSPSIKVYPLKLSHFSTHTPTHELVSEKSVEKNK